MPAVNRLPELQSTLKSLLVSSSSSSLHAEPDAPSYPPRPSSPFVDGLGLLSRKGKKRKRLSEDEKKEQKEEKEFLGEGYMIVSVGWHHFFVYPTTEKNEGDGDLWTCLNIVRTPLFALESPPSHPSSISIHIPTSPRLPFSSPFAFPSFLPRIITTAQLRRPRARRREGCGESEVEKVGKEQVVE